RMILGSARRVRHNRTNISPTFWNMLRVDQSNDDWPSTAPDRSGLPGIKLYQPAISIRRFAEYSLESIRGCSGCGLRLREGFLFLAKRDVEHAPAFSVWAGLILEQPEKERALFGFRGGVAAVEVPKQGLA